MRRSRRTISAIKMFSFRVISNALALCVCLDGLTITRYVSYKSDFRLSGEFSDKRDAPAKVGAFGIIYNLNRGFSTTRGREMVYYWGKRRGKVYEKISFLGSSVFAYTFTVRRSFFRYYVCRVVIRKIRYKRRRFHCESHLWRYRCFRSGILYCHWVVRCVCGSFAEDFGLEKRCKVLRMRCRTWLLCAV